MAEMRCDIHTLISDIVVLADSAVLLVKDTDAVPLVKDSDAVPLVKDSDAVPLVKNSDPDHGWRLPGGPLRHGEHPEAAARRLLQEQIGTVPEFMDLADVDSLPGANWHLYFHFRADLDRRPEPGEGISELRLFQLEHLPATRHGTWERDVIYRVISK